MSEQATRAPIHRWFMVVMATLLMICLGTVYAWSYFQTPIMKAYGWNNSQVSLIFSFAILFLGLAAAIGGVFLPRVGPRKLAVSGSVLFSIGYLVAALALSTRSLALLYIGYGVIGGTGLGLGYVTPVTTIAKWFPDRKGLATGIVVMGFGFGALVMSKVLAPLILGLTGNNLITAFLLFAVIFFALTMTGSVFLRNPPAGWNPGDAKQAISAGTVRATTYAGASSLTPPAAAVLTDARGATPSASTGAHGAAPSATAAVPSTGAFRAAKNDIFSARFLLLWCMFFCNISAGITVVGFQSPMYQKLLAAANPSLTTSALAALGATLIAITSLFNGFGRFFWGAVSDRVGRIATFRIMLGSELVIFVALIITRQPILFAALLCWVLLCYGGGFGIMPSAVAELFHPSKMTVIYGVVLTAWAAGGVVGPQITAFIQDRVPQRASSLSFIVGACFVTLGFVVSLLLPTRVSAAHTSR